MATGALATMAYVVFEGSLIGIFAYFTNDALDRWFGCRRQLAAHRASSASSSIGVFGYFDINIAAAFLGVTLIAEVVLLGALGVRGAVSAAAAPTGWCPRRSTRSTPSRTSPAGGGMGLGDRRHDDRGRQRGHRPVLRVLVVGRLRDHRRLRRGVAQPQAHRPPRHADRRRRPRHSSTRSCSWMMIAGNGKATVDREGQHRLDRPVGRASPRTSSAAPSSATSTCSSSSSARSPAALAFHNAASRYLYAIGRELPATANTLGAHARHAPHAARRLGGAERRSRWC